MPKLKVEKIVSFSSEDPVFPASNLLSGDPSKKWKCSTRGEDSASVVLQLEQATKITALDIGNEHSAYIEVLVNRSSQGATEDFKVLLATSSFMSALDSRQSTNVNKVRMFPPEQLSKPECDEKWDRIKIVCSQPFNKHIQYGISFIAFHSSEVKEQKDEVAAKTLGKFTLRPDSPQDFAVGSLFANRNESAPAPALTGAPAPALTGAPAPALTGAAAIRLAANSPASLHTKTPLLNKLKQSKEGSLPSTFSRRLSDVEVEIDETKRKRNRNDLLYTKDEEDSNDKIDKLIAKKLAEKDEKKAKEQLEADKKEKERITKLQRNKKLQAMSDKKANKVSNKILDSDDSDTDHPENKDTSPNKKANTSPTNKNQTTHNNKRKATNNGAVSNKKIKKLKKPFHKLLEGVVFTISGIQNPDRANLRSEGLSMGAKYKGDWDSSCTHLICAFVNTPKFLQVRGKGKIVNKYWITDCHLRRKRLPWRKYALDRNDYGSESEEEIFEDDGEKSEESDHEVVASTSTKVDDKEENKKDDKNLPGTSKDKQQSDLPELPNFFSNRFFYVDDDLSNVDKQLLKKYITAYNGTIMSDVNEATVILTSIENVVNLKSNCSDQAEFISSEWIWECHNRQKCVSPTDFMMI